MPNSNTSFPQNGLKDVARFIDLDRPLALFDLETTGLEFGEDRVIQIGIQRLDAGGSIEEFETLVNPGRPIPDKVQDLTGITTKMVQGAPSFPKIAAQVNRLLGDADLAGFNIIRFDVPFLEAEFEQYELRLSAPPNRQLLDAYQIFRGKEKHTLERAVAHYTGQTFKQSHQAMDDVEATVRVLAVQLAQYGWSGSVSEIAAQARHPYLDAERKLKQDGKAVVVCFGKHQGKTIEHIEASEPGYLDWMAETIGGEVGRIVTERRDVLHREDPDPFLPVDSSSASDSILPPFEGMIEPFDNLYGGSRDESKHSGQNGEGESEDPLPF